MPSLALGGAQPFHLRRSENTTDLVRVGQAVFSQNPALVLPYVFSWQVFGQLAPQRPVQVRAGEKDQAVIGRALL